VLVLRGELLLQAAFFLPLNGFFSDHPVLHQEPGGGVGNADRFALREMYHSRLVVKHKAQELFAMRLLGVAGF
jgi:hypothetical protein